MFLGIKIKLEKNHLGLTTLEHKFQEFVDE